MFVFLEKSGGAYYFQCIDFADKNDPKGIVTLTAAQLKELLQSTP